VLICKLIDTIQYKPINWHLNTKKLNNNDDDDDDNYDDDCF